MLQVANLPEDMWEIAGRSTADMIRALAQLVLGVALRKLELSECYPSRLILSAPAEQGSVKMFFEAETSFASAKSARPDNVPHSSFIPDAD
jgi:hypothetical protein